MGSRPASTEETADCRRPAANAQKAEHVLEVLLDGSRRDGQRLGDLSVGPTLSHKGQDLGLASGQTGLGGARGQNGVEAIEDG